MTDRVMARSKTGSPPDQLLHRNIATGRRFAVLSALCGCAVPQAVVRLLPRLSPDGLGRHDWLSLFAIAAW